MYTVIYNPNAGKKFRIDVRAEIEKNLPCNIIDTKGPLEATRIARKHKEVIIAGGDGTINEVVNGLTKGSIIGIIPIGSENVLAKELGVPRNIKKACDVIKNGKIEAIDVGKIGKRKFIFSAGIGFDAHAITKVSNVEKLFLGTGSYRLGALKALFDYTPHKITIETEDYRDDGYFIVINNLKHYGAKINITPEARFNDGFLDACIFKEKNLMALIKYIYLAIIGKKIVGKHITHRKFKKAKITSTSPVLYHTDAEVEGKTPTEVKVIPEFLKIYL